MALITIMTDFGLKDANIGVMKGVIHGIDPNANIIDLSHLIEPQNIVEASYLLTRSAPYFPQGTIHIVVVDPGVGTNRKPMIAKIGEWYFIGPDNGFITGVLEWAESQGMPTEFVHLTNPKYWLKHVSHVFHGRDIFAPVAAHLSGGNVISSFGEILYSPVRIVLPKPEIASMKIKGSVIYIDNFGSLVTNITQSHLNSIGMNKTNVIVRLGMKTIIGMVNTFGEKGPGELICLYSSTGNVIVSVVNGSARQETGSMVGDEILLEMIGESHE